MKKALKVIGFAAAAVTVLAAGRAASRTAHRKLAQTLRLARLQRTVSAARNKVPC